MIIFIYVSGFYAAVEAADEPARGPLIVGGDPRKGGTVTSAGDAARDAGVVPGMGVREALELCPGAELRTTRLPRYREVAAELRSIVRPYATSLEAEGLDGTYLQARSAQEPVKLAAQLCVQIQSELGLRALAGIAPSRFAAHLAARRAGHAGIREISDERVPGFLGEFDVTEIWGLGPATAEKLRQVQVQTIAELRGLERAQLEAISGARNAGAFLELARGEDRRPLRPVTPVKSLSRERTLTQPTADLRTLAEAIGSLANQLGELLARERCGARTLTLGVTFLDGERVQRSRTHANPLLQSDELAELGVELLGRTQAAIRGARRLRLQATRLAAQSGDPGPKQLRLF